jgi:hypothetical protein
MGADARQGELRRRGFALPILFVFLTGLLIASQSAPAGSPYEPNDAVPGAFGPLELGKSYGAALETPSDRDFYFFYVTAPGLPQVELSVQNLGGGGSVANFNVTVFDSKITPVAAQPYVGKGEARVVSATLEPGKYLVEVAPNQGYGDSYVLGSAGGKGAFGTYAQIAGRCARASSAVASGETGLGRAEAKLQRATARLRRSRYAGAVARDKARAAHRRAKSRVRSKRRALREAREAGDPWCAITQ